MRRLLTVLACAALVVGSGAPVWANGKSQSDDQSITAMGRDGHHGGHGDHDGRRGHGDRRGHRDHDGGYRHHRGGYDRDYYGHRHHRYRYGYDRDYYYDGYYGCGYYPDCDPYYGGGYYGGRRYYNDRYYYDRNDCGYRGPRYDSRCDCYHRDTRCDRDRYRDSDRRCGGGGGDCYRSYAAETQPEATTPAANPAPAAESPSPQEQSTVVAYHEEHQAAPVPDKPSGEAMNPAPAPEPASEAAPSSEPAPEPAPAPAEEEHGSPDKTVHPASTNPDPQAEPGTGKAHYDREAHDSGEELF